MKRFHADEVILAVCRQLVAEIGVESVTRDTVQAALRERAKEAGARPVGADHRVVGVLLDRAKEEVRESRVEAARAAASASDVELPSGLEDLLARHAREVQDLCRDSVAATLERSRIDADMRVTQVTAAAQGEVLVLQTDLQVARAERDTLAEELDHANESQESLQARVALISTDLVNCTTNLANLQRGSREELALLAQDLRLAQEARGRAEERALAADGRVGDAKTVNALLLERIGLLQASCDASREAAAQRREQVIYAERRCAEARGRIGALEEECARFRNTRQ